MRPIRRNRPVNATGEALKSPTDRLRLVSAKIQTITTVREGGVSWQSHRSCSSTRGACIHSVAPDAPVLEAIRLMAEHGVGALLVMSGEQLIGVVSERDYARKVILKGRSSNDTPVRQIMSSPVLTVRAISRYTIACAS